ncbi:hypothetical protein D3C72_160780 [compost metagenome]
MTKASNRASGIRRGAGLGLLLALSVLAGCANNVTGLAREVLRIQIQTKGALITNNPGIKYYLVLNTSSSTEGPRGYGPWALDRPRLGWHLPFYLSAETPTYQGTVPLLPVRVTDYFVLTNVAGVTQVTQGRLLGPNDAQGIPQPPTGGIFDPTNTLLETYRVLQQGQDWTVSGNTWSLTLTKADLTTIPESQNAPIAANLFSTNHSPERGDQIIDRWTMSENDFFTIQTRAGSLTSDRNFSSPLIRPENKPTNVDADAVDFSAYQVEIRSTQ